MLCKKKVVLLRTFEKFHGNKKTKYILVQLSIFTIGHWY